MKYIICLLLLINTHLAVAKPNPQYLGFRHLHNGYAHHALRFMQNKAMRIFSRGRVHIYQVTSKNFNYQQLPLYVKNQFFPLKMSDLVLGPKFPLETIKQVNPRIVRVLDQLSIKQYKSYVTNLTKIGPRDSNGSAKEYLIAEIRKMGLKVSASDYNIVVKIPGKLDSSMVIMGHMDTVRNTVGADDNASGSGGVLELLRVSSNIFRQQIPKHTLYFVLSEDEEIGLKGAKRFVAQMEKAGLLKKIKLMINMDMIAYNQNKVVDLETSSKFRKYADEFAKNVLRYTKLKPNLVLNPWGSDHIPFIQKGVPAVLTIENWKSHTPCWHRTCDTLDTLNFPYAMEILKLNLSMILAMNAQ
jgi:hypothetical protein